MRLQNTQFKKGDDQINRNTANHTQIKKGESWPRKLKSNHNNSIEIFSGQFRNEI